MIAPRSILRLRFPEAEEFPDTLGFEDALRRALDLFVGYFSLGFFWINISWSAVNLLPIYSLDGGQVMLAPAKSSSGVRTTLYVSTACAILVGGLFLAQRSWFAGLFFLYMGYVNFQTSRAMEQM